MLSSVFKTMEMHLKTSFYERFKLEKHVNHAAVIHGAWNVETNDMYMIIRRIFHRFSTRLPLHFPNRDLALQR